MAQKKLTAGSPAPDFSLPDASGNMVSLSTFRGSWLILYFYPRDNTSGCTLEAVDFTDRVNDFKTLRASILGISPDTVDSHRKFIEKQGLGITLLSDSERRVVKEYGVWQIKKLYGKESYGVVRSTFLIDPEGIIRQVWEKVKVNGHADEVMESLRKMS
ncbi:MAG TPA: thioredoxin-dependent thiol peroxidase [Spirochaetota bacterium]|nr:thioredoxin-dependent thiol peroxidase [Spirochaetota bacterium]HPL18780.1 thioredoxin-dependent thiol peroxidase [Spirochaetota bacterium]HQF06476.1 thioredoxin-dependent thiol peroxidase [Spirochaetota bacterium]HQH98061.1 thioredoxin-dependent thiol peroxidase [Spirochaetota bacterium]HQJ70795.1 thioredoxin-dependent thiol peroxidase [Spirochaetota bacterium]